MIREERKRKLALVLANVGWWGAFVLTVLHAVNVIPDTTVVLIVLFIGVAISAGVALSRTKLEQTIRGVFMAGSDSMRKKDASDDRRTTEGELEKDHAEGDSKDGGD